MPGKPKMTRDQSLGARPVAAVIARREPLANGSQRLTFSSRPSRWQKAILRLPDAVERRVELDPYGIEILDMCDSRTTVRQIIKRFSKHHRLDLHEAERAVLMFVRTLVRKGIVTIVAN